MSIYLVFATTTAAYAAPSVGGWTAVDTVVAGATTTINATKTIGGKLMKSAVTVAPSATKLGKHLIKGGGAAALALAVPQLLGDGVDWVLDPANNAVKYKPVTDDGGGQYLWRSVGGTAYSTMNALCQSDYRVANGNADCVLDGNTVKGTVVGDPNTSFGAIGYRSTNPDYVPPAEYEYLPIDTVAAQVIGNAESGNVPSQEAVKAAALEGFAAGEHDAALEAGATESEAGTDNPPDTADPNNPAEPENPAEPFDPSSIIDAIKKLGAILTGILSSITSLSDMFGDSPSEPENTDVPIDDAPPVRAPNEFDTEYVNFGGQCPSFGSHDISVGSVSVPLTIDITPLCELAELVRPAVIGGAYLVATGLVVAAIREA
tara:strand:+ start:1422 stop:2546 length:1125 start_codon:yes stop_codon:yes gene_type:complete